MAKQEFLIKGQRVWLETTSRHGCDVRHEDEPSEMIVLEANKTSAYIWHDEKSTVRYKVNQKTHEVKYAIPDGRSYRLWLSKEAYEEQVTYEKERKQLLEKVREKLYIMSNEDLRAFIQ